MLPEPVADEPFKGEMHQAGACSIVNCILWDTIDVCLT